MDVELILIYEFI